MFSQPLDVDLVDSPVQIFERDKLWTYYKIPAIAKRIREQRF